MRLLTLSGLLLLAACAAERSAYPPDTTDPVAVLDGIELHASFWQNLHLTLYAAARSNLPDDAGLRPITGIPIEPLEGPLTPAEREQWDAAVTWYEETVAHLDLRTGGGMSGLHRALAQSDTALVESPAIPPELRALLLGAAPVYHEYWWADQEEEIRIWIEDVADRVRRAGPDLPTRIATLLGTEWFAEPVRADITFYGRAFTTLRPEPLTMMAVVDPAYSGWAGAEMLFHEVGHALVDPLRERIAEEADAAGTNPRDLWHVVLFYIVGETWRSTLADQGVDYVPYMKENGLFDRAWSVVREPVVTNIDPYLAGEVDLETAIRRLIEALPE